MTNSFNYCLHTRPQMRADYSIICLACGVDITQIVVGEDAGGR